MSITFAAVGDISFYGQMGEDAVAHGADWLFDPMRATLARADVLFGNMESVALPPDYPEAEIDPHGLIARLPGDLGAAALKRAGFDFLNLAANHVLDAGRVGMDYTRACLEQVGIATAGVGYTQEEARQMRVLEKHGLRFGFLCYGEDSNYTLGHTNPSYAYYEVDTVVEDVKRHRPTVDVLVVSIHADLEFMPTPSVPRLRNSRAIAEAGATIILEHHPHVPQGIEMVNGCLIAYSLGNFLFDAHTGSYMKNNGPHTSHSFVLLAEVSKAGVESWERVPFVIAEPPEQRPAPVAGEVHAQALAYLADLDAKLQDGEFVKATWRAVANRHLAGLIKELSTRDLDNVLEECVGRYCILAENRSWMQEILDMGKEHWLAQQQVDDPLHRPHYRFQSRG